MYIYILTRYHFQVFQIPYDSKAQKKINLTSILLLRLRLRLHLILLLLSVISCVFCWFIFRFDRKKKNSFRKKNTYTEPAPRASWQIKWKKKKKSSNRTTTTKKKVYIKCKMFLIEFRLLSALFIFRINFQFFFVLFSYFLYRIVWKKLFPYTVLLLLFLLGQLDVFFFFFVFCFVLLHFQLCSYIFVCRL